MYSQTKSYVGIAIGLLEAEGKLSLNDTLVSHFEEKVEGELHPYMKRLTIRDMLMMATCGDCPITRFSEEGTAPVRVYLNHSRVTHPSNTSWKYDGSGSQVLTALVEKLSGKPLHEYLREKIFCHLGTFKTAQMLQIPHGESFGSSALLCTPRDMASFARFLMNRGTWGGKQPKALCCEGQCILPSSRSDQRKNLCLRCKSARNY